MCLIESLVKAQIVSQRRSTTFSNFYYEEGDTRIADLRPEFAEEARKIAADIKEAAMKAEFFAPTEPEDPWSGKELRFETTDLDGNPVRSEELFAQHKVTMLNVWATWCGPCKGELQELGEINRRVQDQDGNPVKGVTVQFCSEAECVLGKTDADGAASFDMPEGPGHEIHLLKVPEGFEKDGTTYSAPETYGDIVLVLNKAA